MDIVFPGRFVCLDLETTGLDPARSKIMEVAAISYRDGKKEDEFQTFVNPGEPIPRLIHAITGISDADVKDAPGFDAIREDLAAFIGDYPILGQNIQFDIAFLRENGIPLRGNGSYDTRTLASILLPDASALNLEVLALEFGFDHVDAHRAIADVAMTVKVFDALYQRLKLVSPDAQALLLSLLSKRTWDLKEVFELAFDGVSPHSTSTASLDMVKRLQVASSQSDMTIDFSYADGVIEDGDLAMLVASIADGKRLLVDGHHEKGYPDFELAAAALASSKSKKTTVYAMSSSQLHYVIRDVIPRLGTAMQQWVKPAVTSRTLRVVPFSSPDRSVCMGRFAEFLGHSGLVHRHLPTVLKVALWLTGTQTGLIDEIHLTADDYAMLPYITAHQSCRSAQCPVGEACHLYRSVVAAKQADLVIIDHRSLLLDAIKYHGLSYDSVIVDQADVLEDVGTFALSTKLDAVRLYTIYDQLGADHKRSGLLAALFHDGGTSLAPQLQALMEVVDGLHQHTTLTFGLLGMVAKSRADSSQPYAQRLLLDDDIKSSLSWSNVRDSFLTLQSKIRDLAAGIRGFVERDGEHIGEVRRRQLADFADQLDECMSLIEYLVVRQDESFVYTVTLRPSGEVDMQMAPVRIGHYLRKYVYAKSSSVVLFSRLFSTARLEAFLRDRLQLDESFELARMNSSLMPEETARICLLTVSGIKSASSPLFYHDIARVVVDAAMNANGRVFVLFPSRRLLESVFYEINERLAAQKIDVFADGLMGGTQKMIRKFMHNERSVLLGGGGFWDRYPLQGLAISCMIITKLPFPYPGDPLLSSQSKEYDNAFLSLSVPRAVTKFRHAFDQFRDAPLSDGSERKSFIVLDQRVRQSYGQDFLQSLPEVGLVEEVSLADLGQKVAGE
jgi:Rad3-related DNA helicase/DNA polymerase III epsilon subunit-like protein